MGNLDLDKPSPARMYDYLLGGSHNFAIDRAATEKVLDIIPDMALSARANRAFLRRVVRFLLSRGIDQFLDIGSGIPTVSNVHEIAQRANPEAGVVYVDIDPIVVHQSRALLHSNPRAAVIHADARRPDLFLEHPETRRLLDLDRPLGVILSAVLPFIVNDDEALATVRLLRERTAPGSYLAIAHGTNEGLADNVIDRMTRLYAGSASPAKVRSRREIASYFGGLELVGPGPVFAPLWHPESEDDLLLDSPERSLTLVGLGLKS